MTHRLKIAKEYADEIIVGNKMFEIRFNDRNFQKGDLVKFTVNDRDTTEFSWDKEKYDDFECSEFEITYVLSYFPDGLKENYVILGIDERKRRHRNEKDI